MGNFESIGTQGESAKRLENALLWGLVALAKRVFLLGGAWTIRKESWEVKAGYVRCMGEKSTARPG